MSEPALTLQPDPNLGRVLLDQYRIDALLDRGGMGAIYRGTQLSVNRPVAVKLIASNVERSAEHVARFRREAEAMARLRHPNTVRLFDFGVTDEGQLFMVMELLIGRDLENHLRHSRTLTLPQALGIARQIAQSLSEAHSQGIVHRDLKPGNVFLSHIEGGDSFVKVMDFGIAGIDEDSTRTQLTKTGAIVGTPAYMSPEQAQGFTVDGRADLYSLGLLMFEMLVGRSPFEATSAVSLLVAQISHQPPPLELVCPDLPQQAQAQALLDRLLAKEPADRFATAADVITAIDGLLVQLGPASLIDVPPLSAPFVGLHHLPTPGHRTPLGWTHATPRVSTAPRTRRRVGFALTVGALALLAGAFFYLESSRDARGAVQQGPVAAASALWETGRKSATQLADIAKQKLASNGEMLAHVTIASSPSGASVRLAGAELGKTPYQLVLKRPMEIEIVSPMHASRLITVTPDGEPNIVVSLDPLPPIAAGATN